MKNTFSITHKKNLFFIFLLVLFLVDTAYSYYQYSFAPIDGDIAWFIAPADSYKPVLKDPFGFSILKTGEYYSASNRFFMQAHNYIFFRQVPLALQCILSPIESVYTSMALAKTMLHVGLILLLSSYISVCLGWNSNQFLLAAVLLCPLFQAAGFFEYFCLIDPCITYTFAYALFTLLLGIFLFPYYRAAITGHSGLPSWLKPFWLLFAVVLAFGGPITGPVLLIVCPGTLLYLFFKHWIQYDNLGLWHRFIKSITTIHWQLLVSFSFTTLLCLYSFYIGTHNSENLWTDLSLRERYDRLAQGIIHVAFTWEEGFLPIGLALFFNILILHRFRDVTTERLFFIFNCLFVFAAFYLLLLPLGGYRPYRPFIVRRDTLQPILWIVFFCWGASSLSVLYQLTSIKRTVYAAFLVSVGLFYTLTDKLPTYSNDCEKKSMALIAASKEDCVELTETCTVMQWSNTNQCLDTKCAAEVLYLWKITPKMTPYRHKP